MSPAEEKATVKLSPCQSGRNAGTLAGLVLIAAAAPAGAGPTGWAHQAAGFQSNGAVTVKSLAGGSYAGTRNPTGAVAKANQNAATQAPTVIIQATANGSPVLMFTGRKYNGDLGGVTGADAKCAAEFGSGWRFAEIGQLANVQPGLTTQAWINDGSGSGNTCNSWTSTSAQGSPIGVGTNNLWIMGSSYTCSVSNRLACVNY